MSRVFQSCKKHQQLLIIKLLIFYPPLYPLFLIQNYSWTTTPTPGMEHIPGVGMCSIPGVHIYCWYISSWCHKPHQMVFFLFVFFMTDRLIHTCMVTHTHMHTHIYTCSSSTDTDPGMCSIPGVYIYRWYISSWCHKPHQMVIFLFVFFMTDRLIHTCTHTCTHIRDRPIIGRADYRRRYSAF